MNVSLINMNNGEIGEIKSINGNPEKKLDRKKRGKGFERRLTDMGLTPGTKIIVVKSAPFHGPIEILVRGSRLAIGRGVAERIFLDVKR